MRIFYLSQVKYHPGITTLPIIIGSVLCILYSDAKYVGSILRQRCLIYLGSISYSIYLVHWPLIVFYKYLYQKISLTPLEQLSLLVSTIVIASIMHHCIENKFRTISVSIFTKTGIGFIFAFSILLLCNHSINIYNGYPQRLVKYSVKQSTMSKYAGNISKYSSWNAGVNILGDKSKKPIAIFAGDSYLGQYVEAIDQFFKQKKESVYIIGEHACRLINNTYHHFGFTACVKRTEEYYQLLSKNDLPVIRINNWDTLINENVIFYDKNKDIINVNDKDIFEEINKQATINHHDTLFIIPQPYISFYLDKKGVTPVYDFVLKNQKQNCRSDTVRILSNEKITELSKNHNKKYFEIYDLLCDKNMINTFSEKESISYYSHTGHLSRAGAKFIWGKIGENVYKFIKKHRIKK